MSDEIIVIPSSPTEIAVYEGQPGPPGTPGAPGATGPSGVVSVTSPITNSGTSTAAVIGLDTSGLVTTSQKGVANGVATLDGSALIPQNQLPAVAITNTFVASSQSAMLALTAQEGDVAVRTDISKSFILTAVPASTLSNWQELLSPAQGVTSITASSPLTGGTITSTGTIGIDQTALSIQPSQVAGTAVITTDSRLSNSRTPTAHASTHGTAGSDPVTIAPSQVTGTAVITTDSRLSDARTPLDASVTDAKIATTLSPNKITGTAVTQADTGTVSNTMLAGSIANAKLANSSVTVNGSTIALGGSATVTAAPTAHASSHASGGSDAITIAESQVTNLVTDLAAKASAADITAAFDSNSTTLFTTSRRGTTASLTPVSGTIYFNFFTPLTSFTVNKLSFVAGGTAFTSPTLIRFGLFEWDGTTATLRARTANTTVATVNNFNTADLDATGGFPASYTLTAGIRYAIAFIWTGTTAGTLAATAAPGIPAYATAAPFIATTKTGQTDLPSSPGGTVTGFTATGTSQVLLGRLT